MWYQMVVDRKWLPDKILRLLIRYSLSQYSKRIRKLGYSELDSYRKTFLDQSLSGPIALDPNKANLQHYELPTELFEVILGKYMKYSASIWDKNTRDIDSAEELTLKSYMVRAEIKNGQKILDLGAGWGSFSIFLAENLLDSEITAITNSETQKEFIELQCQEKNIDNLIVLKKDVNNLSLDMKFDRIISIEMLEHTRNVKKLMDLVSDWMTYESKFFIQVFAHRFYPQYFDDMENSWMAKHFFSGGMMPYPDLYKDLDSRLILTKSWFESGEHYHKTLESWLERLDRYLRAGNLKQNKQLFPSQGGILLNRFRFFLLICSELFSYNHGDDWILVNHLFHKQ